MRLGRTVYVSSLALLLAAGSVGGALASGEVSKTPQIVRYSVVERKGACSVPDLAALPLPLGVAGLDGAAGVQQGGAGESPHARIEGAPQQQKQ